MSVQVSRSKSAKVYLPKSKSSSSLQFGRSLRHYLSDPNFNLKLNELNHSQFLTEKIPVLLKGGYQVNPNLLAQESETLTLKCYFTVVEEKLFGMSSKHNRGLVVVHFAKMYIFIKGKKCKCLNLKNVTYQTETDPLNFDVINFKALNEGTGKMERVVLLADRASDLQRLRKIRSKITNYYEDYTRSFKKKRSFNKVVKDVELTNRYYLKLNTDALKNEHVFNDKERDNLKLKEEVLTDPKRTVLEMPSSKTISDVQPLQPSLKTENLKFMLKPIESHDLNFKQFEDSKIKMQNDMYIDDIEVTSQEKYKEDIAKELYPLDLTTDEASDKNKIVGQKNSFVPVTLNSESKLNTHHQDNESCNLKKTNLNMLLTKDEGVISEILDVKKNGELNKESLIQSHPNSGFNPPELKNLDSKDFKDLQPQGKVYKINKKINNITSTFGFEVDLDVNIVNVRNDSKFDEGLLEPKNSIEKKNLKKIKRHLIFNETTEIYETFSKLEYDRTAMPKKSYEQADKEELEEFLIESGKTVKGVKGFANKLKYGFSKRD
ncbi:hypothetical protein HK099_004127 [Clydaea vesicula]|uniref:Uncharacterized protein n=1 Tax=Clydaea vesicula TaxID=447962 RepID=A0AAD5U5D2_9FUNG|nr:hypothetical protein HK099_004127 [Clydaea vesicula]